MKTKVQSLLPLLLFVLMTSCDKVEHPSLSFYADYFEVPIHGTALISLKTGSGNYKLEVKNPLLIWAEMESGWSNPSGTIAVRGDLKGETWLTVTDNVTKESQKLKIKVTDKYETMRILKADKTDKGETPPFPASLSKIEFICLVNNKARDFYLVNRENISLTDYVYKVRGKGTYTLGMEGEDYRLTISYPVDETNHPTLEAKAAKTDSYRFRLSTNDYVLHRLNQNLYLGFDTTMPDNWNEFVSREWETRVMMDGIDTEYKISGHLLPDFKMPVGFLN